MSKTLDEQFRDYCLREGFNDGKEFGIKQGSVETLVKCVHALMSNNNVDAETAMNMLDIDPNSREEIKRSL